MCDFPEQLPHGMFSEVLDGVFFIQGQIRPNFGGPTTFQFSRNMTVVRDGHDLTLLNTMRLDEEGLAALDAMGTVKHIVRLGAFHGRDDAFYLDRYPKATFWAAAGTPFERGERVAQPLADGEEGPCEGSQAFLWKTGKMPEAILCLERHNGILISCDSLQNWTEADAFFDDVSAERMAEMGFFAPANVGPGWYGASEPQEADFKRVAAMEYRHLLSAHGRPLLHEAKPAVDQTLTRFIS